VNEEWTNVVHSGILETFAGALAGSIAWASIYPLDTIKSAVQAAPEGSLQSRYASLSIARDILRRHGPAYFFRGFGACILRAAPVNAVIWPVYEETLRLLGETVLPF